MQILRVQNESGTGPYWCSRKKKSQAIVNMQDEHDASPSTHPPAHKDSGIDRHIERNEHCGFLNNEQLYNWFTDKELDILAKDDFFVTAVEGKITATGKCQVLFIPNIN